MRRGGLAVSPWKLIVAVVAVPHVIGSFACAGLLALSTGSTEMHFGSDAVHPVDFPLPPPPGGELSHVVTYHPALLLRETHVLLHYKLVAIDDPERVLDSLTDQLEPGWATNRQQGELTAEQGHRRLRALARERWNSPGVLLTLESWTEVP